jgi:hypothetical protein
VLLQKQAEIQVNANGVFQTAAHAHLRHQPRVVKGTIRNAVIVPIRSQSFLSGHAYPPAWKDASENPPQTLLPCLPAG